MEEGVAARGCMYPKLYPAEHHHVKASLAGSWIDSEEPLRPFPLRTACQFLAAKSLLLRSLEPAHRAASDRRPVLQEPTGLTRLLSRTTCPMRPQQNLIRVCGQIRHGFRLLIQIDDETRAPQINAVTLQVASSVVIVGGFRKDLRMRL